MKILEPGRPGDLVMLLRTALAATEAAKSIADPEEQAAVVIATTMTTRDALLMWLGEIPVVDMPEEPLH